MMEVPITQKTFHCFAAQICHEKVNQVLKMFLNNFVTQGEHWTKEQHFSTVWQMFYKSQSGKFEINSRITKPYDVKMF